MNEYEWGQIREMSKGLWPKADPTDEYNQLFRGHFGNTDYSSLMHALTRVRSERKPYGSDPVEICHVRKALQDNADDRGQDRKQRLLQRHSEVSYQEMHEYEADRQDIIDALKAIPATELIEYIQEFEPRREMMGLTKPPSTNVDGMTEMYRGFLYAMLLNQKEMTA